MRLTVEEHPEAIKRYRDMKRAGWGARPCSIACPGTTRTCSRERGHRGPHVAHGRFRRVTAVWDAVSGTAVVAGPPRRPTPKSNRSSGSRKPIGLPTRSPTGVAERVVGVVKRLLSSPDEVIFIALFIVFVKFAIDVLLTLY